MKKCPWCGREYPDEASVCAIDQSPLPSNAPAPAADVAETPVEEAFAAWPKPVRFLLLFLRYVAAIFVAFVASFAGMYGAFFLLMTTGIDFFVLVFLAAGFSGVFVGTLCLPPASRRFGSGTLLILGLGYYVYMLEGMDFLREENNTQPYFWLWPLAGGGVLAMLLHWRDTSNKPLPAATPAEKEV